jgi:hypothetical protein
MMSIGMVPHMQAGNEIDQEHSGLQHSDLQSLSDLHRPRRQGDQPAFVVLKRMGRQKRAYQLCLLTRLQIAWSHKNNAKALGRVISDRIREMIIPRDK